MDTLVAKRMLPLDWEEFVLSFVPSRAVSSGVSIWKMELPESMLHAAIPQAWFVSRGIGGKA